MPATPRRAEATGTALDPAPEAEIDPLFVVRVVCHQTSDADKAVPEFGPLQDGMLVNRSLLAPLVREVRARGRAPASLAHPRRALRRPRSTRTAPCRTCPPSALTRRGRR